MVKVANIVKLCSIIGTIHSKWCPLMCFSINGEQYNYQVLTLHSNQIKTSSPKGVWKNNNKGKNEKSWLSPGIEPRATDFSHECSNHCAMTTLYFQGLHIFFPFYWWVVLLAAISYSTDYQLCAVRTPFRCRPQTPPR